MGEVNANRRDAAYRIRDSDEPNLGLLVLLDGVPLELPNVNAMVEQDGALGGCVRPMGVVALVFGGVGDGGVCGGGGGWFGLFLGFLGLFLEDLLGDACLEIGREHCATRSKEERQASMSRFGLFGKSFRNKH